MTKAQERAENILRHGMQLQRIFPASRRFGPVELCKKLHRIEVSEHRRAEQECNGEAEADDARDNRVLARINDMLGNDDAGIPIFLNGDPRGYTLKIHDTTVREKGLDIHTDWGGYGIICPEF